MRLIFLYVSDGGSHPNMSWNPNIKAANFYSNRVLEEGYYYLLKRMLEIGILDELVIFVESSKGQGYINYDHPKIHGWVMPNITELDRLLKEDDIIFVRGGFKGWYETLVKIRNNNNWVLLYAANTGRERWPIFDVIFNDLTGDNKIDSRGTLQFDFKKPINYNIFYPKAIEPEFDLCIGASYIHDKKGQWRTIEALLEYKKIFGENLKCVMPGAMRRGTKTPQMIETINSGEIDVYLPGMVSRKKLNKIYNRSKLFIHLGGGGQGDRGPLEAMRCGTPVIVGNTRRHSKVVYQNVDVSFVISENANKEAVARVLHCMVNKHSKKRRKKVYNYYEEHAGIESVILPEMRELFGIFKKHSKRNTKALSDHYFKKEEVDYAKKK